MQTLIREEKMPAAHGKSKRKVRSDFLFGKVPSCKTQIICFPCMDTSCPTETQLRRGPQLPPITRGWEREKGHSDPSSCLVPPPFPQCAHDHSSVGPASRGSLLVLGEMPSPQGRWFLEEEMCAQVGPAEAEGESMLCSALNVHMLFREQVVRSTSQNQTAHLEA